MRVAMVLAAAQLAAVDAGAQTILNVERFHARDVDGPHLGLTLSGSASFGNTEVVNARGEGIAGNRFGRHWPRIIVGGSYLRQRGSAPIVDNQFVQLRYSYALTERWSTFHFVQVQRNQTLLLRERELLGSGVRVIVAADDRTAFDVGTGVMLEREVREPEALGPGDAARVNEVRMANLAVLRHQLPSGARITGVTYFQPGVRDAGNFRLLQDLAVQAPVTSAVGLSLTGSWRYDSRPPAALRRSDVSLSVGVDVDLR